MAKKASSLRRVPKSLRAWLEPDEVAVVMRIAAAAAGDALWSLVQRKKAPRWRWHALDHRSGTVLADVLGRRQDEMLVTLQALVEPFGLTR